MKLNACVNEKIKIQAFLREKFPIFCNKTRKKALFECMKEGMPPNFIMLNILQAKSPLTSRLAPISHFHFQTPYQRAQKRLWQDKLTHSFTPIAPQNSLPSPTLIQRSIICNTPTTYFQQRKKICSATHYNHNLLRCFLLLSITAIKTFHRKY